MAGSGYILLYCIYILNVHSCHFNKDISINITVICSDVWNVTFDVWQYEAQEVYFRCLMLILSAGPVEILVWLYLERMQFANLTVYYCAACFIVLVNCCVN